MKKEKSYGEVKSVHRALDILEFIAAQSGKITSNNISEDLGIPLGTVMMHLATLEKREYITQRTGYWRLADQVALLWATQRLNLKDKSREVEKRLKRIDV